MESLNVSNEAQRVRAFLRCLGFENDQDTGRLTDRICQHIRQEQTDVDPDKAALEEVFDRRAAWFTAVNEYMLQGQPGSDPLVGWHFRRMIQKHPDAFLGEPDMEKLDVPAALTVRATPAIRENEMPPQPLQPLPAGLRLQFWRSVAAGLKGTRQKIMAYWGRE